MASNEPIPPFDLYIELEVDPGATTETIEAAWRSLVRRHHPDAGSSDERIKRLNLARDWLTDPERRRRYDADRLRREGDWRRYESSRPREESPGAAGMGTGGSFSDRYRGTAHEGHTGAAAREEAERILAEDRAAERRGLARAALLGGVLVVAVLGVGAFILTRPAPPAATPRPTPVFQTQDPAVGEAAITAFRAAVATEPATPYVVEALSDIRVDRARGTVQFRSSVAGDDSAGTLIGTLVSGQRDWVHLGGDGWARTDEGEWTALRSFDRDRGWAPWDELDGATLRFVRFETKGTVRVAIVQVTGWVPLDPRDYLDAEYELVAVDRGEVTLDVDAPTGAPLQMVADSRLTVTDADGEEHELRAQTTYEFSAWGEPVDIAAPD